MASPQERINVGAFLPTTSVWDTSEIQTVDINSQEFRDLLVRLYQNINNIALSVNIRDAGYYDQTEFINGQLFFPDPSLSSTTAQTPTYRQVFRKVVDFGALTNSSTKNVAHDLDMSVATYIFTRIYGCASDTVGKNFIPLPFGGGAPISVSVNATNVSVTTTSNRTNFTTTYIVLEYIKQ